MTRQELRVFLGGLFCGCGDPAAASGALLSLLRLHDVRLGLVEYEKRLGADALLLMYWLDRLELTEHGGSVFGAWLTKKGEAVRDALAREEGDSFEALNADHCACGYDLTDPDHDCFA